MKNEWKAQASLKVGGFVLVNHSKAPAGRNVGRKKMKSWFFKPRRGEMCNPLGKDNVRIGLKSDKCGICQICYSLSGSIDFISTLPNR